MPGCGARAVLALALLAVVPAAGAAEPREYLAQYLLELRPDQPTAAARIRVVQAERNLKRLRLTMPGNAYSAVSGDGDVSRAGDVVTWDVPRSGGELRYRVVITHRRNDKGYDAFLGERWALFRADDAVPRSAATLRKGARARAELLLDLPASWSAVTPYLPDDTGRLAVNDRARRHTRPVGWILAGQIGTRMDVIGPTTVRIGAPRGQAAARVPMLALIRATLPVLQQELASGPAYLLVVTAGDPMWRGGLSAPNSLFVHSSRPLISENGTSTLVHELVHALAPVPAAVEHDWIDEGLAEYLSLTMLVRGHAISRERFDHAIATFRRRGAGVATMLTRSSSGVVTARAVVVFHDVDLEIKERSAGKSDIFDLVRLLMSEPEPVDIIRLREIAASLAGGKPLEALSPARLPGLR
jgi:hypothetical protein